MEHIDSTDFSDLQKEIVRMRAEGNSLTSIIRHCNEKYSADIRLFTRQAIVHCIERSAEALRWDKGMKGGSDHYLSVPDFEKLKTKVLQSARDDEHLDPEGVLQTAFELKKARIKEGIEFLASTGSPQLAEKLEAQPVDPPVRSWVNKRLSELEAMLKYKRVIDIKRLLACTPEHISEYHNKYSELIRRTPSPLLFGADETMLEASGRKKVLTPDDTAEVIEASITQMPHITSMCCNNVLGTGLPPFIILSELTTIPIELKPFIDRGQIWLASSPSGWQTRDTFLYWTICFVNWLSMYRLTLSPEIRNKDALLIMDGHVSRENPIALVVFKYHHVHVLILPSHTSHVLQMFDVAIASPLKKEFSRLLRILLSTIDRTLPILPQVRQAAITAFVEAWSQTCTAKNARAAARATGTYPCILEPILANRFVRELKPALQRYVATRRHNTDYLISEKVITDDAIIHEINATMKDDERWKHLCLRDAYPSYIDFCKSSVESPHNGCRMLGHLPPYVSTDFPPYLFW